MCVRECIKIASSTPPRLLLLICDWQQERQVHSGVLWGGSGEPPG